MTGHVIESVTFKLAANISDKEFMATQAAIDDFARSSDGFVRRHLSRDENGVWLDVMEWSSMEAAMAAMDAFPKQPSLAPVLAAIDGDTVTIRHGRLMAMLD